jgi:hypothetical protein
MCDTFVVLKTVRSKQSLNMLKFAQSGAPDWEIWVTLTYIPICPWDQEVLGTGDDAQRQLYKIVCLVVFNFGCSVVLRRIAYSWLWKYAKNVGHWRYLRLIFSGNLITQLSVFTTCTDYNRWHWIFFIIRCPRIIFYIKRNNLFGSFATSEVSVNNYFSFFLAFKVIWGVHGSACAQSKDGESGRNRNNRNFNLIYIWTDLLTFNLYLGWFAKIYSVLLEAICCYALNDVLKIKTWKASLAFKLGSCVNGLIIKNLYSDSNVLPPVSSNAFSGQPCLNV